MDTTRENYLVSTDKARLNIDYIHQYLCYQSYWAGNIPIETVRKSIANSMCFGVYDGEKQIGFARMVTDHATFAYLADVFIDENYRGRGLSKWMLEVILAHPDLQGLRRVILSTRDAHTLYSQFGFRQLDFPDRWMNIHNPNVYKGK